jgi:hypothetical protein
VKGVCGGRGKINTEFEEILRSFEAEKTGILGTVGNEENSKKPVGLGR